MRQDDVSQPLPNNLSIAHTSKPAESVPLHPDDATDVSESTYSTISTVSTVSEPKAQKNPMTMKQMNTKQLRKLKKSISKSSHNPQAVLSLLQKIDNSITCEQVIVF